MRALALSLVVLVGCGSKDPSTPTDAPPGGDAARDAPFDAPAAVSKLVINDGTATIAQWTSPSTFVGTSTTMRFFVANLGTTNTGTLTPAVTGPNANQFGLVGTSTCTQLVAGDLCSVDVRFSPASASAATATLSISDGTQHTSIPLMGVALGPPAGLVADVASITFLPITRGDATTAQLIISNSSASTITLGARTAAPPFSVTTDNCPATLTAGGACTVTVRLDGTTVGLNTGMFHLTSSANTLDVPLDGVVLRKITVTGGGFGTGTVTSLPAGISCPSTCSYGFPGGVPIGFTATPDAGNNFAQWGGLCSGMTCSVASPLDGTVSATFVPTSAKKITITMAGTSRGYAGVQSSGGSSGGRCTSSCDIYVPAGSQVTVYGYSPSMFVGWSGDCTSATNDCNIGTVIADRAVTLTTAADPHEVATLLPPAAVTGLAIAPTGNLIVGTSTGVSEVTLAGATVWTTQIAGGATSLATDAAGNIYGLGGPGVFALTSAGAIAWTRTFTGAPVRMLSMHGSLAASPDGTVIAVLTSDGAHVVDGAGVDRFTVSGLTPTPQTVAVAPDGTVGLTQVDQSMASDQTKAVRYTNAGTPLPTFGLLPGHLNTSLAFDITNAVCGISTGTGHSTVFRATAPGVLAFSVDQAPGNAGGIPAGVLTTSSGEVVGIRDQSVSQAQVPGVRIDAYSPTGSSMFTNTKTPTPFAFGSAIGLYDGVQVGRIAAGGTNRIAIAGSYAYSLPWIQVYDLP